MDAFPSPLISPVPVSAPAPAPLPLSPCPCPCPRTLELFRTRYYLPGFHSYRKRYWKKRLFDSVEKVKTALDHVYHGHVTMGEASIRWMYHHSQLDGRYGGKGRHQWAYRAILETLTLSLLSSKNTFSWPFIEVVLVIFHLSKLWKAKFSILCDVLSLVRLQGKFDVDHS